MSGETPSRGCLLDTNIALFSTFESKSISSAARDAIAEGSNFLSVISYWEVTIKSMKGKLDVGDPRQWWREALEQLAAKALPLRAEHIAAVNRLPPIHHDPFDRALIAQAHAERLVLVTTDDTIARYATDRLRVLR